jgi:hypothetical protein
LFFWTAWKAQVMMILLNQGNLMKIVVSDPQMQPGAGELPFIPIQGNLQNSDFPSLLTCDPIFVLSKQKSDTENEQ